MNQTKLSLSLQCPDHNVVVGMLNIDPNAQKVGYCYGCIEESEKNGTAIQNLKSVSGYLNDCSSFYEKCRQRVVNAGEPPAEYIEKLSKQGERLEKLSKHIDEEKDKVKKTFEEIRKTVLRIVDQKEKECFELLDKEIWDLSEAHREFEKLLTIGWPKPSDLSNIYPDVDALRERVSKIDSLDQLRAFVAGIEKDVQTHDDEHGIKKKIDDLIQGFSLPESNLPKIQGKILTSEDLEKTVKDLMKGFSQERVYIKDSTRARTKGSSLESKIISDVQFQTVKNWVPSSFRNDFELLYRGSVDGFSPQKFHENCDNKGATVTLIKCRFDVNLSYSILGGFIDQSWHSNKCWTSSEDAFLFSFREQKPPVRCSIAKYEAQYAFYGGPQEGPIFGSGDLTLSKDLKTGSIYPKSYPNSAALKNDNVNTFTVEEIEVYQTK